MNLRRILVAGTVALSALVALNFSPAVEASETNEWQARTVEEVKADFEEVKDKDEKTYTIQSGDTLSVIAEAADVDLDALARVNNIENKNLIFPGNKLTFDLDKAGAVKAVEVEDQNGKQQQKIAVPKQAQKPAAKRQAQPQHQAQAAPQVPAGTNAAKEEIARRESGGSYSARNGRYIGRYQLDSRYLNGDYSPANQERVAEQYVANRYGSWDNALAHWNSHGWY